MHGTIHRPVWALAIICASCAGPYQKENRYYRCGFPDGDPDVHNVGDACIPNANATEATSQCACTKRCEEKKANSPDNHPIHELDCNLVTATDLTEPSIACTPPDQDLLTECVEDPPTPMYRCLGPIADSCTVDEGAVETNWPLEIAYIDICKQPGEDLDDVHNRCRQQCEDMFAEFEDDIGGSCDIDQNKCVGLAYPQPVFDAEGECMASEMAPDPKGEWMGNLAWPGDDGIPTSQPLACRYATDCCTAYGREACDNLNLGLAGRRPVAEKASTLRGTLTLVPSRGSGVVVDVEGEVTFSARSCANANGTCPLYIEQLGLRMLRASGPVDVEGVSARLRKLTARLDLPTLGIVESNSGALKLPRRKLSMTVSGEAIVDGQSVRLEQTMALPDEIAGSFDRSRGLMALTGDLHQPGAGATQVKVNLRAQPAVSARTQGGER